MKWDIQIKLNLIMVNMNLNIISWSNIDFKPLRVLINFDGWSEVKEFIDDIRSKESGSWAVFKKINS